MGPRRLVVPGLLAGLAVGGSLLAAVLISSRVLPVLPVGAGYGGFTAPSASASASPSQGACSCPALPTDTVQPGSANFSWGPLTDSAGNNIFASYPANTFSYGIEITSAAPAVANNTLPDPTRVFAAPSQLYSGQNGSTGFTGTDGQMGVTAGNTYYARIIAWTDWDTVLHQVVAAHFVGVFSNANAFVAQ